MSYRRVLALAPIVSALALVNWSCGESVGPARQRTAPPAASAVAGAGGIQLDQWNAAMGSQTNPQIIIKGFNPTNPHVGDAIVATFFWFGAPGGVSGNIIESVTDVLTTNPYTPVGNDYRLVEFVTNGSVSMATYVATNVQNFPDAGTDVSLILAVKANLKVPAADAGILISAWTGVAGATSEALGEHRSASGSGSSWLLGPPTSATTGPISLNPGALAYAVGLTSPAAGYEGTAGWTSFAAPSDVVMRGDGSYDAQFTLSPTGGSTQPSWTWYFNAPGTWLASTLALNPAPTP
jgi:hypothetical protein